MIKYTVQNWLTPKGEWINKKGLTPTTIIEQEDIEKDNQLDKALELLIRDLKE